VRWFLFLTLALSCGGMLHATDKDTLLFESRYPYLFMQMLDLPEASRLSLADDNYGEIFEWERPFHDLLFRSSADEGVTARGFIWLYDTDVFFGRGQFPEARRDPLREGNNYNRTLNNDLMQSDDYVYREGVVRGQLDLTFKRSFEKGILDAELTVITGENFSAEGTALKFGHIAYDYNDKWHFRIGEVHPYFDPFTLNKKDTPVPGFEMSTTIAGAEFYFVAGRPDFPLEFSNNKTEEIVLTASSWSSGDVIHHFPQPYNMFETAAVPVRVYRHSLSSGLISIEDITSLCTITYADVIIPRSVVTEDTQKIVIEAGKSGLSSEQTMYLNAFQLVHTYEFSGMSVTAALAYVDLHNDTHSAENIQGLIGPMDSNIWSFRTQMIKGKFTAEGQCAISKFTPDDDIFNKREVDAFYKAAILYGTEKDIVSFHAGYHYFGADYLPNVLTLRDAWKIQQDADADFAWDYESDAMPGAETITAGITVNALTVHSLTVRYTDDLESTYLQHSFAADYDPLYIPYYGTESNGLNIYGPGIDDGRKKLNITLSETYKWLTLSAAYDTDCDATMIVTQKERDERSWTFGVVARTTPVDVSISYITADGRMDFDPRAEQFIVNDTDNTLKASVRYHYGMQITDPMWVKLIGLIPSSLS